jgi:hypothetical protein
MEIREWSVNYNEDVFPNAAHSELGIIYNYENIEMKTISIEYA